MFFHRVWVPLNSYVCNMDFKTYWSPSSNSNECYSSINVLIKINIIAKTMYENITSFMSTRSRSECYYKGNKFSFGIVLNSIYFFFFYHVVQMKVLGTSLFNMLSPLNNSICAHSKLGISMPYLAFV